MATSKVATVTPQQVAVQTTKENLYIVALPPDQFKTLDATRGIVQSAGGGRHMLTLVNEKPKGSSASMAASAPASLTSSPGTAEKRNVAEILASLSGLNPEPQQQKQQPHLKQQTAKSEVVVATKTVATPPPSTSASQTPPASSSSASQTVSGPPPKATAVTATVSRPMASILSAPGSRIVRVLQGGSASATKQPSLAQAPAVPTAATAGGASRSRKQVLVTTMDKDLEEERKAGGGGGGGEEGEKEAASSSSSSSATVTASSEAGGSVETPTEKPASVKSAEGEDETGVEVGRVQDEDDGDILEEDLDDIEYIPYSKKKSAKQQKGKGKSPKK